MIDSFERQYFESTLPNFIHEQLSKLTMNVSSKGVTSIGVLQFKLFNLVNKRVERTIFVQIMLRECTKMLEMVSQKLGDDQHNIGLLKNVCLLHIYLWKFKDELQGKKKQCLIQKNQVQFQQQLNQIEKQQKYLEKIVWDMKVEAEMFNPGNFQLIMIQMLREVTDSQRLSHRFMTRMRKFMENNDIAPVDKFMKILGEEHHEQQSTVFMVANSADLTPRNTKSQVTQLGIFAKSQCALSSYSKQTPTNSEMMSNNDSSISRLQVQKRIFKSNRVANLGRTIFMSHPFRHRVQKDQKTKQVIEYVDGKELM